MSTFASWITSPYISNIEMLSHITSLADIVQPDFSTRVPSMQVCYVSAWTEDRHHWRVLTAKHFRQQTDHVLTTQQQWCVFLYFTTSQETLWSNNDAELCSQEKELQHEVWATELQRRSNSSEEPTVINPILRMLKTPTIFTSPQFWKPERPSVLCLAFFTLLMLLAFKKPSIFRRKFLSADKWLAS